MDLGRFAGNVQQFPEKPAVIMGDTGFALTYADLDRLSNQGAHFLRSLGLRTGDTLALCLENAPHFFLGKSELRDVKCSASMSVVRNRKC